MCSYHDAGGYDRQSDSRDGEPPARPPRLDAMPYGKPPRSGVQINIHPRIAGCGCFMLSALAMLVGCGLLLIIVWGFLIPDWRTNNSYLQASAIVLDKRLVANDSADVMFCEAVCLIAGPLSEVAMHCRDRPTLIRV